jgi:DNA-binding MarR family transcriptional regulator
MGLLLNQNSDRGLRSGLNISVPKQSSSFSLSLLSKKFLEVIPRSMWSIRYGMRAAAQSDFTVPQFRVMAILWQESRTNSELAEQIGISVPAMSRMVEGLVNLRLVTRVPQEHDRRQVKLELSSEGKKRFQRLRKATEGIFNEKFATLDAGKRTKLMEGLAVLEELFP